MSDRVVELVRSSWISVMLEASGWGGSRTDAEASREVEQNNGATTGSVRAVKQLMVTAKGEIDLVRSHQRALRQYLDQVSVPFGRGARLVPTSKILDILGELGRRREAMRAAVAVLASVWDERVKTSLDALGGLADPTLYPRAEDVSALFDVKVSCAPLPEGRDYSRLALPVDAAQALAERMEREQVTAVDSMRKEIANRTKDAVIRVKGILQKKLDGARTRLHDSAMEEIAIVTMLLKEIDFDGSLSAIISELEGITKKPIDDIRDKKHVQEEVRVKFDELEQQLNGMFFDSQEE